MIPTNQRNLMVGCQEITSILWNNEPAPFGSLRGKIFFGPKKNFFFLRGKDFFGGKNEFFLKENEKKILDKIWIFVVDFFNIIVPYFD